MLKTVQSNLAALAVAAGFTLAAVTGAVAAPKVGQAAPEFSGMTSNGETVSLKDLSDKRVILEWTNHDCPYVRKHYETDNMQKLQKDTTGNGTVWLTVISSAPGKQGYVSPEKANELTTSRGAAPSHVVLDPEGAIGKMYKAETTPHMYIIEKGTLMYMGAIDDNPSASKKTVEGAKNYVRQALSEIDAGKPVSEPATKAYGCSVKYK